MHSFDYGKTNTLNPDKGRIFEVNLDGLVLPFHLYTINEIEDELEPFSDKIKYTLISGLNEDEIKKQIQHDKQYFFAYIKFFKCDNKKYGIVGGKTNTLNPDISFDYEDNSKKFSGISRHFLNVNDYKWYSGILLIERKRPNTTNEQQALFLEAFLQRSFNLFDS